MCNLSVVWLCDGGEGSWAGATQRRVPGRGKRRCTRKAISSAALRSSLTGGWSRLDTVSTSQLQDPTLYSLVTYVLLTELSLLHYSEMVELVAS